MEKILRRNKNLSDRIYRINRIIFQAAPEERSETRIHQIALLAAGDGLLSAAADFRPASNILSILLILSKAFLLFEEG